MTTPAPLPYHLPARKCRAAPISVISNCVILSFGLWTASCHVAVAAHLPFRSLARVGPFAIAAGIICGILTAKTDASSQDPDPGLSVSSPSLQWAWFASAATIVILRALGMGYTVFWLLAVILALAWLRKLRPPSASPSAVLSNRAARTCPGVITVLLLALGCAALTYIAHRPDTDDALFIGLAADAVAHPVLPVLHHDPLYGDQRFPLILPTYAVHSYELFIALLARTFGGEPIVWAHAILPTALAAFLPLAWARLMGLMTRHWAAATAVVVVLLILLGESHYSFGNFAFVRLFQGKAVLAAIGIPLLYACAWEFMKTGAFRNWLILVFCTLSCLGCSAAAIFVVPMALATATISGWSQGYFSRACLAFAPAAYPIAWGLALRPSFQTVSGVFVSVRRDVPGTVADVFGAHGQYLLLFAIIASPLFARSARLQWRLAALSAVYLLVPLNPLLFKLISRLTTPESVWRILWSAPVVGIAAAATVNAIDLAYEKWHTRGLVFAIVACLICFAWLAPHSSLRRSNGVTFSGSPLKVSHPGWEVSGAASVLTPSGTALLAPESISAWASVRVHRPLLVSVREIYDQQMGVRMTPDEAKQRRELRQLVSDENFSLPPDQSLLDSLPRFHVGAIVTTASAGDRLRRAFLARGYGEQLTIDKYVIFLATTAHPN